MSTQVSKTIVKSKSPEKKTLPGKPIPRNPVMRASSAVQKDRLVYRVAECAELYLSALVDPFDTPNGACIPASLFPLPSQKVKATARGTFNLGTSGIGFIAANPSPWRGVAVVSFTTTTSVGTSSTTLGSFTNLAGGSIPALPYTAPLTNEVSARIVACGLRIKYIGKAMDCNGTVASYEDPDHVNVISNNQQLSWYASPYVSVTRVDTESRWDKSVCYSGPASPSDFEFQTSTIPLALGPFMGICVAGIAGDLYEWEITEHVEYIGSLANGRTKTHSEPVSFGKVIEAVKSATETSALEPFKAPKIWKNFQNLMTETLPKMASGAKTLVEAYSTSNPLKAWEGLHALRSGFSNYLNATYGSPLRHYSLTSNASRS